MSLELKIVNDHSFASQEFKVFEPEDYSTYITDLAKEYCSLRTECATTIDSINIEGIGVVNTDKIHSLVVGQFEYDGKRSSSNRVAR